MDCVTFADPISAHDCVKVLLWLDCQHLLYIGFFVKQGRVETFRKVHLHLLELKGGASIKSAMCSGMLGLLK
jgi:hypothetical protein